MTYIQLHATAATLGQYRRLMPPPFSVLHVLSRSRNGDADVEVGLSGRFPYVRISLRDLASPWAEQLVSRCRFPHVFAFGSVTIASGGIRRRLDVQGFIESEPESTRLRIETEETGDGEWISIEFSEDQRAWFSPPELNRAITDNTWAGAPTDQSRRAVHVRCLGTSFVVQQTALGVTCSKKTVMVSEGELFMQAVLSPATTSSAGRVRHIGTGVTVETSSLHTVRSGVSVDLDFDILASNDEDAPISGDSCLHIAKDEIVNWIGQLISGEAGERLVTAFERSKRKLALDKLEERRRELHSCRFANYNQKPVFREPTNENQLVALFLKLESLGALPFGCCVVEYTPKTGIDAIGHFRLETDGVTELYGPIEFEFRFGSFVEHRHPIRHTKLVVCWSTDDQHGRRLSRSTEPWLSFYTAKGCRVPVIEVAKLPGLTLEKSDAEHLDS